LMRPLWCARLARVAVRLPYPIAAFRAQGRLSQLSAINRSRGRAPVARSAQLSIFGGERKRHSRRKHLRKQRLWPHCAGA
jgi:hypothetical protein